MVNFKNLIFLSFLLLFINYSYINAENAETEKRPFRLVVLASGPYTDLGFNNMVNQGRISVSKYLNITDSDFYNIKNQDDMDVLVEPLVKDNLADFIICSSLDVRDACISLAVKYENVSKTQFLIRGSFKATKNQMYVTYNFASANFVSGYFAGLTTKTGNIGFLSPGITANNNNDSFVYAFWVGAKLANPDIKFYYYNIGSYYNYDKTIRATKELMETYNCDVFGDTLDDFTLGNVVINSGKRALGTNGFPQKTVYGENVLYSFSYNWTKAFLPFTQRVMNNLDPNKTYISNSNSYMDFNANKDLSFFELEFSIDVNETAKALLLQQVNSLTSIPRAQHPYYCNKYIPTYNLPYNTTTNCISTSAFFYINAPFPGMTYLGLYNISIEEAKFSSSVQYGFSIVSGILILLVLLMILGIAVFNKTPSIRSASPIFLSFILLGGMIVYIGCIVWVSPISTHQCNARLWLVTLGFTTLIGSMVVKNVRIWLIFDNPELKAIKITNYQLFPWVGAFIVINVILMSILTSVGDLRMVEEMGIDGIGSYEFMRVCKMNSQGAATLYTILGYFAALLLVGVFVSWKIRIVDIQEFNESKPIANTLYAISFCLFVIVPLMVAPQEKQSETIVLCTAGLFITTAALFILFIPKFWRVLRVHSGEESSSDFFRTKKASATATARAESASKNSNGSAGKSGSTKSSKTNRRGNMIEEFSDDSESSVHSPPPPPPQSQTTPNGDNEVAAGAVLDLTDDSTSEFDNNQDNEQLENNENTPPVNSIDQSDSLNNSVNNSTQN